VLEGLRLRYGYDYVVTPQGVYFVRLGDPPGRDSLEYLDLATGKVKLLLRTSRPADLGLTISPDGRWLLYAQTEAFGSDLILVENFR
jgi:hypothetical protein